MYPPSLLLLSTLVPPVLTRDSEHIVCRMCTPGVCVRPQKKKKKTVYPRGLSCLSRRPKRTLNLSSSGSSGGTCEFWTGKRKSGTTETPADKHAHKSALTGIVYPSAALFHRHGSEVTLLSTECGFLWDVRVCERQIRSYYPSLAVPPDYLRALCRHHILHCSACRPLISSVGPYQHQRQPGRHRRVERSGEADASGVR